ncbi:MAG: Xylose isomerase domain protein barrel [Gemmatimonadetes bacterium]|nr:Xylose isomerase domain protein barrel [Gemmatimonadota bacterium]
MPTRRQFLGTLGASLGGAAVASACARASNAGDSTAAGRTPKSLPPGLQLYTVRDRMKRDPEGTLAEVARIGYRELEFAGYHGRTPAQLRATLDRLGVRAPSSHVGLDELTDRLPETVSAARIMGHEFLVLAWIDDAMRKDWRKTAATLNDIGRRVHDSGLRFAYHNHDFEFATLNGQVGYDVLVAETNPDHVELEMDLYWVTKAGVDPMKYLRAFPTRISMVHLKDATAAPERNMVDVGAGVLDFPALLAASARIEHAFVEHDEPKDSLASAAASFNYLSRMKK